MRGLDSIGIDGVDASGKDLLIGKVFGDRFQIRCGGVNKINGDIEFSLRVLYNQYLEASGLLGKIVLNRTFISFMVGKIINGVISHHQITDIYNYFSVNLGFKNRINLILIRGEDDIRNSILRRGYISDYEKRLISSKTLIGEQQELFKEIGKLAGAIVIENTGTIEDFTKKVSLFK